MSFDLSIDTNEEEVVPVGLGGEGFSLNAGVELDHEEIFVDPTPGEVPELAADVELLVSLESRLHDLDYLRQDIERTHGMTQSFAMEAERLLPGVTGVPLGYFTKTPTATRYQLSLEGLSKGLWALIAAAAVAVAAAIVKFYQWLSGNATTKDPAKAAEQAKDKAQENEKKAEENVETLKDLPKRAEKARLIYDAGDMYPKTDKSDKPIYATVDSFVHAFLLEDERFGRVKRFMQMDNAVFRDILTEGPYTQAFRQVAGRLLEISSVMAEREKMIGAAIERDLQPHGMLQRGMNLRQLTISTEPFKLVIGARSFTLEDAADVFGQIRQKAVTDHHKPQPMDVDQAIDAATRSYENSQIVQFFQYQRETVDTLYQMEKRLTELNDHLGNVASDGTPGQTTEGVGPAIRDAVFKFGQEINAFRRLFAELYTYGSHLDRLSMEVTGLVSALETKLFTLSRTRGLELPDDWKLAMAKASMSRYQTLFSHVNPAVHAAGGNWR
jgi:hypothetical protein